MPNPAKTFSELSLLQTLKDNLDRARFVVPTPIQAHTLAPTLAGHDILGTAHTGSGKTLAFILPIFDRLMRSNGRGVEALVLAPTRELATQIVETSKIIGKNTGISVALMVGGLSESPQLQAIARGARMVIATPGRLYDYVQRNLINLRAVHTLVLDEADRMVDMGFLPQMRVILHALPRERQTMCFSATLEPSVAHLVREYLKNPVRIEIGSTRAPAESVALRICKISREQKFPLLTHLLRTENGTFLIFTRTKHGADKLVRKLKQIGFDAAALHGNKSQSQRIRALEGFKRGTHRILVATDLAARGIHVDKIAHVINFDMPGAAEDFIHRVGRTGRVEERGTATTFVTPDEIRDIQNIERALGKKIGIMPLPDRLPSEPRSLHEETENLQNQRRHSLHGPRHFGRREQY